MGINYDELMDLTDIKIDEDTSKIDEIIEYEEILFEISKCLKEYRKEKKLTQKQLAKLLGFDQVMISKLESGNYNPTFKLLHKISRKLTNSADLFVKVIENIADSINKMYKTTYDLIIDEKEYSKDSGESIVYIDFSKLKTQGGYYDTDKCTSPVSNAG